MLICLYLTRFFGAELERRHENLIGISAYPDDYRLIVRLDGIRHELPLYDVWD